MLDSLPDVDWLLGGRGYDADWFRDALKDKGIRACIPGRRQRRKPVKYDKRQYKRRSRDCAPSASRLIPTGPLQIDLCSRSQGGSRRTKGYSAEPARLESVFERTATELRPQGWCDLPQWVRDTYSGIGDGSPMLETATAPMLRVRATLRQELAALEKQVRQLAQDDPVCHRLMTMPGIGAVVVLTFRAAVDDPTRFRSSKRVGPWVGLTPSRNQSGERDVSGGITKAGDSNLRRHCFRQPSR